MSDNGDLSNELWQQLFGNVDADAEDEAFFSNHFVSNFKYTMFSSKDPFKIVIGNKGTGKSAFLRRFLQDHEKVPSALCVRIDAPKLISDMSGTAVNGAAAVYAWRQYFQVQAANAILADKIEDIAGLKSAGLTGVTGSFIAAIAKMASKATSALSDEILKTGKRLDDQTRLVFLVDDLDKGWSGSELELSFVRNLLTAMYDVSLRDKSISFRVSLRWDIFDKISKSMADIDKIRPHVVYLSWAPHEVYVIGAKRICAALGRPFAAEYVLDSGIGQDTISRFYDPIISRRYQGEGGWTNTSSRRVLMSFVRRRPRDLFAFLGKAAEQALNLRKRKIGSEEISLVFKSYSDDRVNDLLAEYRSRMPALETLLESYRPRKQGRSSESFNFTNDKMQIHLKGVLKEKTEIKFIGEKSTPDTRSLIEFLYRIEFLQAYRSSGGFIERYDFELQQKVFFGDKEVGFSWEVLPAYRWWLEPVDRNFVTASLKPHLDERQIQ